MTQNLKQTLFNHMDALEQCIEETRETLQHHNTTSQQQNPQHTTPQQNPQQKHDAQEQTIWKKRYQTLCKRHVQASLHVTRATNAIKQLLTRIDG